MNSEIAPERSSPSTRTTGMCWRSRASPTSIRLPSPAACREREYAALADDPDKPLLDRALRGTYPSGSTIKPAIALAALTYHAIDPNKIFYSTGIFHLPGNSFIWREDRTGPRGALDMEEAIARSSDVYFYNVASILGVDRIDTFLTPFGYGQLTGIDIAGEKPGVLPSPAVEDASTSSDPRTRSGFPVIPSISAWDRATCW